MPSKDEVRVIQKRELTKLKLVEMGLSPISQVVMATEAEMEAEDVAYVNEKIAQYAQNIKS